LEPLPSSSAGGIGFHSPGTSTCDSMNASIARCNSSRSSRPFASINCSTMWIIASPVIRCSWLITSERRRTDRSTALYGPALARRRW
jgi:hypothetical protein